MKKAGWKCQNRGRPVFSHIDQTSLVKKDLAQNNLFIVRDRYQRQKSRAGITSPMMPSRVARRNTSSCRPYNKSHQSFVIIYVLDIHHCWTSFILFLNSKHGPFMWQWDILKNMVDSYFKRKVCLCVFDCLLGNECSPFTNYFTGKITRNRHSSAVEFPEVKLEFARQRFLVF